ncbi:Gfo/Idh/MocA family protein [Urechidicola vernalis]|uniref:Gfo/Idh/MocA family oxidoreductase n=1 Tax=Urechidicola vernalis TaxID=3075600 RepID=A0ABU2Y2E6_9FLAO|nr:Gfo/Idh/MocA family oxidoreductase [Urechidicola sp. P050]MDT0552320.1 Gfo/Idh/MocA family oxidoreductase [Urechidicola sp. P050]
MSDKVKFAVVGCGHIGKRHAEMIDRNVGAELVALVDVESKDKLKIDQFEVPFFSSLEDFLDNDVEVDVVTIATPNGHHASQAIKVLEAGNHVVIEKPIALTKADAEKVIFKALHLGKQVFAVMQNRYSPPSVWIKEVMDQKRLGAIYSVHINSFWNRDERYYTKESWHGDKRLDGGSLFTQFSHFIDIMYWLFGDVTNINSVMRDFKHQNMTDFEDTGIVNFEFVNGGVGSFNFSTAVWNKNMESSMTIIGEKGAVKIGGQYMNEVEYCHIKDYDMPNLEETNPGNDYGTYKGSAQNHHFVIQNVIDVLQNKKAITTNALEGMKIVDIIERMYQSTK